LRIEGVPSRPPDGWKSLFDNEVSEVIILRPESPVYVDAFHSEALRSYNYVLKYIHETTTIVSHSRPDRPF